MKRLGSVKENQGAALIVAIAVMTILLAIGLTFFTVSRLELKTATNVENSVRADLLATGATSIAISFLNHDVVSHPTYTSLDHAWKTYFNGLWYAEKVNHGPGFATPGWMDDPRQQDAPRLPRILYGDPAHAGEDKGVLGHIYTPREEPSFVANPGAYSPVLNPFVTDPARELTIPEQIARYADIDNDEDGQADSVWIPLVADVFLGGRDTDGDGAPDEGTGDGVDNDLDGVIDEIDETGTFLYYGGNDGFDNDNNGNVDDGNEDRWFLTAPINAVDKSYIVLYGVQIGGNLVDINTDPTLPWPNRWVDALDNDYNYIANQHKEYYAGIPQPAPPAEENPQILTVAEFNERNGYVEIAPAYLRPPNAATELRIKTTAEPVCEIMGRAAILISDEASKVNMNVAGGGTPDVPAIDRYVASGDISLPEAMLNRDADLPSGVDSLWTEPLGDGATTAEYVTAILPRVAMPRSHKLWNLLTGAPFGILDVGAAFNVPISDSFVPDIMLPGYGFVDDNGNALALASNGIDDDGDGLVDEGINTGQYLTQEQIKKAYSYGRRANWFPTTTDPATIETRAREVYERELGYFEGVDEPGELQRRRSLRNEVAEKNGADDDRNGTVDEPGEMGDRVLRTREEVKKAVLNEEYASGVQGLADGFLGRLKPVLTLHSTDKANRHDVVDNFWASGPRELKVDFNYATPEQTAAALRQSLFLEPQVFDDSNLAWGFGNGLFQEGVKVENAPGYVPIYNAYFRALQLGLSVRDFTDRDFARSESVFEVPDPWWSALQVGAGASEASFDRRVISYTLAGNEGIRITEMMVRPVRRVEAEMSMNPGDVYLNPNTGISLFATAGFPDFNMQIVGDTETSVAAYPILPHPDDPLETGARYWPLPGSVANPPAYPSYPPIIGRDCFMLTRHEFLLIHANAPNVPVIAQRRPNVMEFRFAPGPGLPPGRYYLTINTLYVDPDTGLQVPTVYQENDVLVATKYVDETGTVTEIPLRPSVQDPPPSIPIAERRPTITVGAKTILEDLEAYFAFTPLPDVVDFWQSGAWSEPVIGRERMYGTATADPERPTGWVFIPSKNNAVARGETAGYGQDVFVPNPAEPDTLPTYTVMIPPYPDVDGIANSGDEQQVYLHVAIAAGPGVWNANAVPEQDLTNGIDDDSDGVIDDNAADPVGRPEDIELRYNNLDDDGDGVVDDAPALLVVNFFDFSQEPDHEWVEIENTTGRDIDISGWTLAVGGVDSKGNLASEDQVSMRVPDDNPYNPGNPVILSGDKTRNRMLLAVNPRDFIYHAENFQSRDPITNEPIFDRPALSPYRDSVFFNNGIGLLDGYLFDNPILSGENLCFAGISSPLMPVRNPVAGPGVDGRGELLPGAGVYNVFSSPDAADRIIPLYVSTLTDAGSTPYGDEESIAKWVLRGGVLPNYPEHDGIDNDFDVEPLGADKIDNNNDGVIDEDYEGVDEGRVWRDTPSEVSPFLYPAPGQFSAGPVHYYGQAINFNDLMIPETFGKDYLGAANQPPDWKEFIERRFFPGDNVMLTLFEGAPDQKRVADRVTYTEFDVSNRAIDDVVRIDIPGYMTRPTLYGSMDINDFYLTFWPENTMGIDFYRTLERKLHSAYNGDRFGTQNRWQATDGNYDDWSHYPVTEEDASGTPTLLRWAGSPLTTNAAEILPDKLLEGVGQVAVKSKPLVSIGELATLPHVELRKRFLQPDPAGDFGRFDPSTGDFRSGLGEEEVGSVLIGQSWPAEKVVLSDGSELPDTSMFNDRNMLIDLGHVARTTLSVAQADFHLLNPTGQSISAQNEWENALLGWGSAGSENPQAWRPVFLYALNNNEPASVSVPGLGSPVDLALNSLFLFRRPPLPGPWNSDGTLMSRWPVERRAVAYVSRNMSDFEIANTDRNTRDGTIAGNAYQWPTEALFVWDAEDGIEDGKYSLYLDFGLDGDALLKADASYYVANGGPLPEASFDPDYHLLTKFGKEEVAEKLSGLRPEQISVDVEVFTDRNGDRRTWTEANNDGRPQYNELNRETLDNKVSESFGRFDSLSPNFERTLPYGPQGGLPVLVEVKNNYLAVMVRNWSAPGTLVPFVGVVLTPRDRTPGRINVNTATTLKYEHQAGELRLFHPLLGVPGLVAGRDFVNGVDLPFAPNNVTPPILSRQTPPFVWTNWNTQIPPDMPYYSVDMTTEVQQERLQRARLIELGRHTMQADGRWQERWDGRYYKRLSELAGFRTAVSYPDGYDHFRLPWASETDLFFPLSASQDTDMRLEEINWRFAKMANLITTRSDVFEIIVTVQAGYGVDENGDGRINYRRNDEFVVTAEKKTRTVYER